MERCSSREEVNVYSLANKVGQCVWILLLRFHSKNLSKLDPPDGRSCPLSRATKPATFIL
ncbi:hypothetical protein Leryth_023442 [Lithospermum erythrorhizon]|nr:hypothetical protein Leryth_023442 [Lithospermum erythrorhizon]